MRQGIEHDHYLILPERVMADGTLRSYIIGEAFAIAELMEESEGLPVELHMGWFGGWVPYQ